MLRYIRDDIGPNLQEFTLDYNSDKLIFTFNEPVLSSTLNVSLITLSASSNIFAINYSLTDGEVEFTSLTSGVLQFQIQLTRIDILELKVSQLIATSQFNTYLSLSFGAIQDTSYTPNEALYYQRVSLFILDATPAEIEDFIFDLNLGILYLTFNDVINISSFDPNGLTLHSSRISINSYSYTLSSTSLAHSQDEYYLNIELSDSDFNSISFIPHLATSLNLTFISYGANLIDDIFGTNILALTSDNAIMASVYIPDSTRPQLVDFDLNVDESMLILYFNEAIDISTLRTDQLKILAGNTSSIYLQLSKLSNSIYLNMTALLIPLPRDFTNLIKLNPNLATSSLNTYLSITNQTVKDFAINLVFPISTDLPKQVRDYIPDSIPPELISFDFDNDQGMNSNYYIIIILTDYYRRGLYLYCTCRLWKQYNDLIHFLNHTK